jgi:DHA1 family multidrug resistance protein-like MFS transporter
MGLDLIRDATIGQVINYLSRGRLLPYADQRPGYVVPKRFLKASEAGSDTTTLCGEDYEKKKQSRGTNTPALERTDTTATLTGVERFRAPGGKTPAPSEPERPSTPATLTTPGDGVVDIPDPYLIDWEENDPDNPQFVPVPFLCCSAVVNWPPTGTGLSESAVLSRSRSLF